MTFSLFGLILILNSTPSFLVVECQITGIRIIPSHVKREGFFMSNEKGLVCYNTVGRRPGVFQIRRGVTSPIGVHLSFVRIFCRSRGDEAVLPRCWRVGPSSDKRGFSLTSTANLVLLERQKALKSIEIQANRVDKTILMKNVFL